MSVDHAEVKARLAAMDDATLLATLGWREGRGEGQVGMRATMWSVRNRVLHPKWWGKNWRECCLKPGQYSCFNTTDPQFAKFGADSTGLDHERWVEAQAIAKEVIAGEGDDPTHGATHYFDLSIAPPAWSKPPAQHTVDIGRLKFLTNVP